MAYETVGLCLAENLQLLNATGGIVVPPQNQVLWNLSNALLNLSMAVEADLHEIRQELTAIRNDIQAL